MSTRSVIHLLVILLLVGVGGCYTLDIDRMQRDIRDVYRQGADNTIAIAGMPYTQAVQLSRGRDVIVGVVMDSSGAEKLQLVRGHFHGYTEQVHDTAEIVQRIQRLKAPAVGTDRISLYRGSTRESALASTHYQAIEVDAKESTDRFALLKIDMNSVAFIVDVEAQEEYASGKSPGAIFLIILLGLAALLGAALGVLAAGLSDDTGGGCLALILGFGAVVGTLYLLLL